MKKLGFIAFFVLVFTAASLAQTVSPSPAPPPVEDPGDIVKINTNLIQIDVTVTDSKGRIVTDLRPEEMEIYENGKKQTITNFSFIDTTGPRPVDSPVTQSGKPAVDVPPAYLPPGEVKRTIALVVDDLSLSFASVARTRQALRKFVDEQMGPNDLVAIIRTGSGSGALQQFTSDKRHLYAAIEKLSWNPIGSGDITSFVPIGREPSHSELAKGQSAMETQAKEFDRNTQQYREDLFTVGTLGAINYIVRGLRELPGRKSIILLSDGFSIGPVGSFSSDVKDSMLRLADLANRSGVVIYTIDVRGLQYLGLTAADDASGMNDQGINEAVSNRSSDFIFNQEGLIFLANATGGKYVINSNDIAGGVQKFLDDQQGYYLVGYQPDEGSFDPAKVKFNKLNVKITRPGLKAGTRSGFFNFTDQKAKAAPKTPADQIIRALNSPFVAGDITVRLAPLFSQDKTRGAYIYSLIHVKASDLQFTDEADGWKKTVFDVVALAFDGEGNVVEQMHQVETMKINQRIYGHIMKEGFVYTVMFPIKKPGAYQMRVALRDSVSARIGSANQFIEVPNLQKDRLALSGLVLQNTAKNENGVTLSVGAVTASDARHDTALRQFKPGTPLSYNLMIYNAQSGKAGPPKLTSQINLYRNGKIIFTGQQMDYPLESGADPKMLPLSGSIRLGTEMEAGVYLLQVVITDLSAKEKHRTRVQWQDFEVVK